MAETYSVENEHYGVTIDRVHGRIVSVVDKARRYDVISVPGEGDNFRILVPLPDMLSNYVIGSAQALSSCDVVGDRMTLKWEGPLRAVRGELDMDVTMGIALVGEAIEFTCAVRNGTEYPLNEVWYPILGGMLGIGPEAQRRETMALVPQANQFWLQNLFTDFGNTRGQTLGVTGAEHIFGYPGFMPMPWVSLFHRGLDCGLCFSALERTPRVKMLRMALEAGTSERRVGGNWPRDDETETPTGVAMNWSHHPFTKPGETFEGATIVLQGHAGDWREAARLYRSWFDTQYEVLDAGADWIRGEPAFLHAMCMLPEDSIHLPFKDLAAWGQAAKDRGIGSVCLGGWNIGGHDRGYPHYEPDPRLGTWAELEAGVRACKAMGLRVYFFVNCQPVDLTTDWNKRELHKYGVMDSFGVPYFVTSTWGMGTLGARAPLSMGRPFGEVNPAHPEVRELLIRQMVKLVEIGADGLHIDKFFQTPFDFNPRLTHTNPDRAMHEGMLLYVEELLAACREVNPEFCFSFEASWDRLMPYCNTSWWRNFDDPMKAAFPERGLSLGIAQPFDFSKANHGILGGDVLMISPANFLHGADHPPTQKLLEYLDEINQIRRELWGTVSCGAMVDASDGLFKRREPMLRVGGTFGESENGRWTLFSNERTGKRVAVLANEGLEAMTAEGIAPADGGSGGCRVLQAFADEVETNWPVSVDVPGERVVFIAER
ncbi:MAG: hypothetical protein CMJ84_15930 [Planctomycetes bacterium]|nr:hypothetical protein [Planctomycetota bacterium]